MRVHVVVKHQPFLGIEHVLPLAHPPLAELRAEINSLVNEHRAAQRPRGGEYELHLDEFAIRRGCASDGFRGDHAVQYLAHGTGDVHGYERDDRAEGSAAVLDAAGHVPVEELDENRSVLNRLLRLDPRVHHRFPPDVILVQVDDASARYRRGGAVEHVVNLEEQAHGAGERNAFVGCEREHLVIVHDGVHRLDPLRVDVPVEHDPLVNVRGVVGHVAERDGH